MTTKEGYKMALNPRQQDLLQQIETADSSARLEKIKAQFKHEFHENDEHDPSVYNQFEKAVGTAEKRLAVQSQLNPTVTNPVAKMLPLESIATANEINQIKEEYKNLKTGYEPEIVNINGIKCLKLTFDSEEEAQTFVGKMSQKFPHIKFHSEEEVEALRQNNSGPANPGAGF